jgi:chitinase
MLTAPPYFSASWEYPNDAGIGCNVVGEKDTQNFLSFLEQLHREKDKDLIVTAAAGIKPWLGSDKTPLKDVSGFAEVLDYVAVMNYDIWGRWSEGVGPNSPLNDDCGSKPGLGSAASAVKAWTEAGMPKNKIVLGVPAYGHSFRVYEKDALKGENLAEFPSFDKDNQPPGDDWDGIPGETDPCGVTSTTPGGIIQYSGMIKLGYIEEDGTPKPDRIHRFDNCSQTVGLPSHFEAPNLIWFNSLSYTLPLTRPWFHTMILR